MLDPSGKEVCVMCGRQWLSCNCLNEEDPSPPQPRHLLAADPGVSGGLVSLREGPRGWDLYAYEKMPGTERDVLEWFRQYAQRGWQCR